VFARFHNLLRGCLLSVGVSNRKATIAVPELIAPPTPAATSTSDEIQAPDPDDELTAWEQDRANTIHDADESEQQGLRMLSRAALLRLVVQFEDEGLFVVAHELRLQADSADRNRAVIPEPELAAPTF